MPTFFFQNVTPDTNISICQCYFCPPSGRISCTPCVPCWSLLARAPPPYTLDEDFPAASSVNDGSADKPGSDALRPKTRQGPTYCHVDNLPSSYNAYERTKLHFLILARSHSVYQCRVCAAHTNICQILRFLMSLKHI